MKNFKFLFILIFCSCVYNESNSYQKEIYSKHFKDLQVDNQLKIIDLKSITSFSELTDKMGEISCEGKVAGLKFEDNETIYHMTGFSNCPTSRTIECYFRRNHIGIKNDSLIIGFDRKDMKSISNLKTELNEIISHPHNFKFRENKVKPALIRLYIEDDQPVTTIFKVLKEIVIQFEKINSAYNPDFFEYTILFQSYDFTNVPPPPPEI